MKIVTAHMHRDSSPGPSSEDLSPWHETQPRVSIGDERPRRDAPDVNDVSVPGPARVRPESQQPPAPSAVTQKPLWYRIVAGRLSIARLVKLATHRNAIIGEIVAAVTLCALVFLDFTSISLQATDSVMVLPFTNVRNDANVEYLADGLSESLTNSLSQLGTVRVIARTTAFAYKGRQIDVRTLGRDLNVRVIITGRVSHTNDRLRVQADVVDARAGTQLWGKQYEGAHESTLQIQQDVVRNVRQHLRMNAGNASTRQLTRPPTSSPQAYDLYLRGRYAVSRATVADTQKGIEYFRKALEIDPVYASAYAGLADGYLWLSGMHLIPKEAMAKAREAAKRAIELDPALPEAHVSMGVTQLFYDYAWRESEEQFKRAIDLNPFEPSVRLWYGWHLVFRGKQQAGIAQALRAHELDPLSAFVETGLAQMYYFAGQAEVAIQRLRTVVKSNPGFFNGHYYLGVAYLHSAQYNEAVRELEQASRLDPQQAQPIAYLAYAYAKLGNMRSAQRRLAELKKVNESRYVSGYVFAVAFVGMGAKEDAIQSLQRAYTDRDDMLVLVKIDPLLKELRTDPRLMELLKRMGLN